MSIFTGAGVALITPMKEDGSVNYDKLEEILEFQIAGGSDAIIICGTTGEASTLSHEEHISCIRYACEVTKKRIPVIAGTGDDRNPLLRHLTGISYAGNMLLMRQRRGLSGSPADNNGIASSGNLEFQNLLQFVIIYAAIFLHWCDQSHTCSRKYRHHYPSFLINSKRNRHRRRLLLSS